MLQYENKKPHKSLPTKKSLKPDYFPDEFHHWKNCNCPPQNLLKKCRGGNPSELIPWGVHKLWFQSQRQYKKTQTNFAYEHWWKNPQNMPANHIQQHLKGLETTTKWELFLECRIFNIWKSNNVIYHISRITHTQNHDHLIDEEKGFDKI